MTDDDRTSIEITSSHGFVAKNYGLIVNYFKGHPRTRRWIYTASTVGTAVLLLAIGTSTYALWPNTAAINHIAAAIPSSPAHVGPGLQLTALRVEKPSKINATVVWPDGPQSAQIDATKANITVQNNGTQQADITAAKVNIRYAEQFTNCTGAGPGFSDGDYDANLPIPMPPRPFPVTRDMDLRVDPGQHESFTVSIGPHDVPTSMNVPYIIVADISLAHDKSPTDLNLGTVALVAPSGRGLDNLKGNTDVRCAAENSKIVDDAYKIPAQRSDELEELHTKYTQMFATDPKPAQQQCKSWPGTTALPKMCATYTRQRLTVSVTLGSDPIPNHSIVIVHLDSSDPNAYQYRVAAGYVPPTAMAARGDPLWASNGIETDVVQSEGFRTTMPTSDGTITFDPNTHVLTFQLTPRLDFGHSLQLSADIKSRDDNGEVTTVASTPSDSKLIVERGH